MNAIPPVFLLPTPVKMPARASGDKDEEACLEEFIKLAEKLEARPWDDFSIKKESEELFREIFRFSDQEKSIRVLNKITGIFPNSIFARPAFYQLAQIHRIKTKNLPEAIDALYKFIHATLPSDLPGSAMMEIANLHREAGDYPNALALYETIVKNYPGSEFAAMALLHMGGIYEYKFRNYEKAIEAYYRVVTELPEFRFTIQAKPKSDDDYQIHSHDSLHAYEGGTLQRTPAFFDTSKLISRIADIYRNRLSDFIPFKMVYEGEIKVEQFTGLNVNLIYSKHGNLITVVPGKLEISETPEETRLNLGETFPKPASEVDIQVIYPNGTKVLFLNAAETIRFNNNVIEAIEFMPRKFFSGLESIVFSSKTDPIAGGRYSGKNLIVYKSQMAKMNVLVHELLHHWDLTLAIGKNLWPLNRLYKSRPWHISGWSDPSELFCQIGWEYKTVIARDWSFPSFLKYSEKQRKLDGMQYLRCDGPQIKKVGQDRCAEDAAYFGSCYALNRPGTWKLVKTEMKDGHFELTAKYLFFAFATPFAEEKSVYSELNNYQEIRNELDLALKAHPRKVPKSTVKAINDIEKKYITDQYKIYLRQTKKVKPF